MNHTSKIIGPKESYRTHSNPPWLSLGSKVSAHMTAAEMLQRGNADYEVFAMPVEVTNPATGATHRVKDRFVTGRFSPRTSELEAWEVVKGRYEIIQNEAVLAKALDVASVSNDDALVDVVGILNRGRKFFVVLDLGQLILDPDGIHDIIGRFIIVSSSHDGSSPVTYANTDVRAICGNTIRFGQLATPNVFTARHTTNVEERMDEATTVLSMSLEWNKTFTDEANRLMSITLPVGGNHIDRVLDVVWPEKEADTDRKCHNRNNVVASVRNRFGSIRNAKGFGRNGWSLLNAIGEHLDHGRNVNKLKAGQDSMERNNLIYRQKLLAHAAILRLE